MSLQNLSLTIPQWLYIISFAQNRTLSDLNYSDCKFKNSSCWLLVTHTSVTPNFGSSYLEDWTFFSLELSTESDHTEERSSYIFTNSKTTLDPFYFTYMQWSTLLHSHNPNQMTSRLHSCQRTDGRVITLLQLCLHGYFRQAPDHPADVLCWSKGAWVQ